MIGFPDSVAEAILDAQLDGTWIGFFSTGPDANGTGGTEMSYTSYSRAQVTWGAAASRRKANTAAAQAGIRTGTPGSNPTAKAWVLFTANGSGGSGTRKLWGWCAGPYKEFIALADNTVYSPAHGYSADQPVIVVKEPGFSLPSGLTEGTVYYVINPTTDDFELSATPGGSAVDIGNGSGVVGASLFQEIAVDQAPIMQADYLSAEM